MQQKVLLIFSLIMLSTASTDAQVLSVKEGFSKDDTLRGTLNENRTWWDVLRYDIEVHPDFETKTISGRSTIKYRSTGGRYMQIDLQQPLMVDSIISGNRHISFERSNNICLLDMPEALQHKGEHFITIYYHGQPREAKRAPWDGGWIWAKDKMGRPWMTVACQGLGASVWYPCKDHQSDEPDEGASLTMVVPDTLVGVANGTLISKIDQQHHSIYRWEVRNPINSYNLIPYIGHYVSFGEEYKGEEGNLRCTYWVMDYDLEKATSQFKQVSSMLACMEYWFGPYPFYEDGYQLVQSPHLGMEHQSAIAYGNNFLNGYRGRDLSGTGWGNLWDFIIIHESGHEWFGNNITSKDIADMWIHESFTNYSETLYTQCQSGIQAGNEYVQGIRKNILNDEPIIGKYGVNTEGSGDMYYKGSNMIHTIRTIIQNDSLFRQMLRDLNKTFYHQTVTTKQIESFISNFAGKDFSKIFDQYLRNTSIPQLQWKISKGKVSVKFDRCIDGFEMPVWVPTGTNEGEWTTIKKGTWTQLPTTLTEAEAESLWNKNLYIDYRAVSPN